MIRTLEEWGVIPRNPPESLSSYPGHEE
jgi:hypothetical protein